MLMEISAVSIDLCCGGIYELAPQMYRGIFPPRKMLGTKAGGNRPSVVILPQVGLQTLQNFIAMFSTCQRPSGRPWIPDQAGNDDSVCGGGFIKTYLQIAPQLSKTYLMR
ncbi:MAG: hypothetical protein COB54_01575 [Alphaproteobacteria bacterium]|nr:MAG: hypothetical protein COB54_01575 [Alphaproteobacteria bacterium]